MSTPQVGDVITTAEELDALPRQIVVWAADGTLAGRYDAQRGVVLGDERPFPWKVLPLPVTVLFVGANQPPRPERVVKAEALREAAEGIQALHPGEVKYSVLWLNERAERIEAGGDLP